MSFKRNALLDITQAQLDNLRWLHKRGGSGALDQHGRLCAGGEPRAQGSWPSWLRLMAHGYLAGVQGRIVITDIGLALLEEPSSKPADSGEATLPLTPPG